MYVLVLPISGGGFTAQLSAIQLLSRREIEYDIVLAASGGNVAAYIAMAADWKENGIERISQMVSSEMFTSRWLPPPLPSTLYGFFCGSIYNKGCGCEDIFNEIYSGISIKNTEIWTGTFNSTQSRPCFFCNKSKDESILNRKKMNLGIIECMNPIYLDGDINVIAKATMASASIPTYVPPVNIEGENYSDGGLYFASPLTVMQDAICERSEKTDSKLHIIYITGRDISECTTKGNDGNLITCGWNSVAEMIRGHLLCERLSAFEMLRKDKPHFVAFPATEDNLKEYIRITKDRSLCSRSVIEIYPIVSNEINIGSFDAYDVSKSMEKARKNMGCRLWWVGAKEEKLNFFTFPKHEFSAYIEGEEICDVITDYDNLLKKEN